MKMRTWFFTLLLAGFLAPTRASFPTITQVTPARGGPGTLVYIAGQNFGFITKVTIGGTEAPIVNRSPLTVTVPVNAKTGPIYVYNNDGFDSTFEYFQVAPRITSFSPAGATPGSGTTVTLTGFNFSNTDFSPVLVYFNDRLSPSVFVVTDLPGGAQLTATVPADGVSGPLSIVTRAGFDTTPVPFLFPPEIQKLDPPKAAAGDTIKVIGKSMLGVSSVFFADIPATFTIQSPTNLLVTVPTNAPDNYLFAANPLYISTGSPFLLLPRIASIEPSHADADQVIAIRGTGLRKILSVAIAGKPATIASNPSSSVVYVKVPQAALTGPVLITTSNGTNTSEGLFYGNPSISSFNPTRGAVGTPVTVTGLNFLGASNALLGSFNAEILNLTAQELTFKVPQGATNAQIRIQTPGGTALSTATFTIIGEEPVISDFSPDFGPPGTVVRITGSKLTSASNVTFNNASATPTVKNDTELTAVVPNNASTGRIRVTTPKGTTSSSRDFLVGDSADLRVNLTASPSPVAPLGELLVRLEVRNNGPLPAAGTHASLSHTGGAEFISYDASDGVVDRAGSIFDWSLGGLSAGRTATLLVRLRAPASGSVRLTSDAENDRPDKVTDNNSGQVTVNVVIPPVPSLLIRQLDAGRIELSWAANGAIVDLQRSPTLSPASWTTVSESPASDGIQWSVTIPATNSTAFLRLRAR